MSLSGQGIRPQDDEAPSIRYATQASGASPDSLIREMSTLSSSIHARCINLNTPSCGHARCSCHCNGEAPFTLDSTVADDKASVGAGDPCCTCGRRHRARRNGILSLRRRRNGFLSVRRRRNGVLAAEEVRADSYDGGSGALIPPIRGKRPTSSLAASTLSSLDGSSRPSCCCSCCCRGGVVSDGGEEEDDAFVSSMVQTLSSSTSGSGLGCQSSAGRKSTGAQRGTYSLTCLAAGSTVVNDGVSTTHARQQPHWQQHLQRSDREALESGISQTVGGTSRRSHPHEWRTLEEEEEEEGEQTQPLEHVRKEQGEEKGEQIRLPAPFSRPAQQLSQQQSEEIIMEDQSYQEAHWCIHSSASFNAITSVTDPPGVYDVYGAPRASLGSPVVRPHPPLFPSTSARSLGVLTTQVQPPLHSQPHRQQRQLSLQQHSQQQRHHPLQQQQHKLQPLDSLQAMSIENAVPQATVIGASPVLHRKGEPQTSAEIAAAAAGSDFETLMLPPVPPLSQSYMHSQGQEAGGLPTSLPIQNRRKLALSNVSPHDGGGSDNNFNITSLAAVARVSGGLRVAGGVTGGVYGKSYTLQAAPSPATGDTGRRLQQAPKVTGSSLAATNMGLRPATEDSTRGPLILSATVQTSPSSTTQQPFPAPFHRKFFPSPAQFEPSLSGAAAAMSATGGSAVPCKSQARPVAASAAGTTLGGSTASSVAGLMLYRLPLRRARSLVTLAGERPDRPPPRGLRVRQLALPGQHVLTHGSLLPLLHAPCKTVPSHWPNDSLRNSQLRNPHQCPRRTASTVSTTTSFQMLSEAMPAASPSGAAAAAAGRLHSPLSSSMFSSVGGPVATSVLPGRGVWATSGPSSRRLSVWSTVTTSNLSDVEVVAEGDDVEDASKSQGPPGEPGNGIAARDGASRHDSSTGSGEGEAGLQDTSLSLNGWDSWGAVPCSAAVETLMTERGSAAAVAAATENSNEGGDSSGGTSALRRPPSMDLTVLVAATPTSRPLTATSASGSPVSQQQQDARVSGSGVRQPGVFNLNSWPQLRGTDGGVTGKSLNELLLLPTSNGDGARATATPVAPVSTSTLHTSTALSSPSRRVPQYPQMSLRAAPVPPSPQDATAAGQGTNLSRWVQPLRQLVRQSPDHARTQPLTDQTATSPTGYESSDGSNASSGGDGGGAGGGERVTLYRRVGAGPPPPPAPSREFVPPSAISLPPI